MIEYRVRSVSLLNLVNDIQKGRLIPDAYFQRNLVWRDVHKKDFIKTILLGYPFPQIFISKGKVDVQTMSTVSCVVDGQQRSDAIISFINGDFDVDGQTYDALPEEKKAEFLKYEVAVIELDLENNDPKVQDIFQRINRTSNSLTSIEKLASAYSTSEFMLVAKLLSDQIDLNRAGGDEFKEDPNIPEEFFVWARKVSVRNFQRIINEKGVFQPREIARKANLMHALNVMSTCIGGFYNRNERATEHLDDFATDFPGKDVLVAELDKAAGVLLKLGLRAKSYWLNKANLFSLLVAVVHHHRAGNEVDVNSFAKKLAGFEKDIPADYKLAASESVNATKARQLRNDYIVQMLA